jgi:hypothetical protein
MQKSNKKIYNCKSEISSGKKNIIKILKKKNLKILALRYPIRRLGNEDYFKHNIQIKNNHVSRERKNISNQKKNNNYYQ